MLELILMQAVWLVSGILIADFISGLLHWAEDRYGSPDWPIVGEAIRETIGHHTRPMRITERTFWELNGRVLIIAAGLGIVFAGIGMPLTMIISAALFGGFSNQIHCWSHTPPARLPRLVRYAQRSGVFLSFEHHAGHHRGLKNTRYCVVTNWFNPLLDRIRFWSGLEALLRRLFQLNVRLDPSINERHLSAER